MPRLPNRLSPAPTPASAASIDATHGSALAPNPFAPLVAHPGPQRMATKSSRDASRGPRPPGVHRRHARSPASDPSLGLRARTTSTPRLEPHTPRGVYRRHARLRLRPQPLCAFCEPYSGPPSPISRPQDATKPGGIESNRASLTNASLIPRTDATCSRPRTPPSPPSSTSFRLLRSGHDPLLDAR